jgi:peptidylprolyl isomerase
MLQKIKAVKPLYALVAVVLVIAAVGLLYFAVGMTSAKVTAGETIQVYYTGTFVNGTVFDSNVGGNVLKFTVGANQVIPGFDQGVRGMALNQNRTLTIPANEAYGPINQTLFVNVPLVAFGNQTIRQGTIITDTATNGQQYRGVVTALNATTATVDFNPPLAGQTLIFSVKVVGITK